MDYFDVANYGFMDVMKARFLEYHRTGRDANGQQYYALVRRAPHTPYITLRKRDEDYDKYDQQFRGVSNSTNIDFFRFFLPLFQIHLGALRDIIVDVDTLIQKLGEFTDLLHGNGQLYGTQIPYNRETDDDTKFRTDARALYPDFFTARGRNDDGNELPSLDTASRDLALRLCIKVDAMFNNGVIENVVYDRDMVVLRKAKSLAFKNITQLSGKQLEKLPGRIAASFGALGTLQLRLLDGFKIVWRWLEIVSNTEVFDCIMGLSKTPIRGLLNEIVHRRAETTDAILDAFNNLHKHGDSNQSQNAKTTAEFVTTVIRNLESYGVPPIPSSSIDASIGNATASSNAQPRDYLRELVRSEGKSKEEQEQRLYLYRAM